jgi:tight adherence protein B
MTTAAVAACCAALAAALALPAPVRLSRRADFPWWSSAALAAPLSVVLHGRTLVAVAIGVVALLGVSALRRRERARAAADDRRRVVVEGCEGLAAELRAGRPPVAALEHVVPDWAELRPALTAARLDADVPAALRRMADRPGAEACGELASAWQLSGRIGIGLADAVDTVTVRARGELTTHQVIASELASAKATARMIALLPVVLLLLSNGSGLGSLRFLIGTTPGLVCLAAGLALAGAGMAWIERIVTRVGAGDT